MINWISSNIGTVIVLAVLTFVVACIIYKMIKDKKNNKSSCGCNCSGCSMSGSCHYYK